MNDDHLYPAKLGTTPGMLTFSPNIGSAPKRTKRKRIPLGGGTLHSQLGQDNYP